MLFHRDGVIGAAFDGGIVGDDQHVSASHAADSGDEAARRGLILVKVPGGERRKLEKR